MKRRAGSQMKLKFRAIEDSDMSNGSPNYETINAAFRTHGLATDNVAYVDIDWSGSAAGDVADDEDLVITVTIDEGSLTLDPPVKLRWRVNSGEGAGGAWEMPMNMTHRELQDDYQVSISSSNYAVGDVIDFYVRAKVEETDKEFTCFPTQGQHDWSVPNSDNIPEERDFFSVLVTDQTKAIALSKDLQTDPGWMVGTDEWEWGAPTLAANGSQPGNDYPFDNDVYQASFAPYCYFTSNSISVNAKWELTTEEFTLSASKEKAVISYALWFYVRGATGGEKFTVDIKDSQSEWHFGIETIDAGSGNTLERWIRHRITVSRGSGPGQIDFGPGMRLRFNADRSQGNGTMEAVVDEVSVWGVDDN